MWFGYFDRIAVQFDLIRHSGRGSLYAGAAPFAHPVYFLLLAPSGATPGEPPATLTLEQTWARPGAYVFATDAITAAPDDLAAALGLVPAYDTTRAVAWVPGGATLAPAALVPITWSSTSSPTVSADTTVDFGNIQLLLPGNQQTTVKLADPNLLSFTGSGIQFQRGGMGVPFVGPEGGTLRVGLDTSAPGRLEFGASPDAFSFYTLFRDNLFDESNPRGGELRYFHGSAANGFSQLVYPVLPEADSGGGGDPTLPLDVDLDPLAPFDGTRTRFRLRVGQVPAGLTASYAHTIAGTPVALTALATAADDRAGFHLGQRPPLATETPGTYGYLAPLGPFAVAPPDGAARLMCGTTGLEYIAAATEDVIEFVPSQPAFAPGFEAKESAAAVLDDTFTTAWAAYRPGGDSPARAYFGQPPASANHGTGVVPAQASGSMTLPAAVASLVRVLPTAPSAPFPLALYGAVFDAREGDAPAGADLLAFERSVLTTVRGEQLRLQPHLVRSVAEPPATPPDPVFADAGGTPLAGGRTTTPQGFLVELNDGNKPGGPAGTWKSAVLAVSGNRHLSFDADAKTGTVDPWLATTLVREQLFLVLNDWSRDPMVNRLLEVAGFNFQIAPPEPDPETILVFKFATSQSLTDLIATTGAWAQSDVFVDDVDKTQATLKAALKVAEDARHQPYDPFVYFRDTIASQSGWTGLIAFNGPIDGNGMPPDLQMLFAGIDGELRAHHFGVEVNRIEPDANKQPAIAESSLFGVIHYPTTGPPPTPSTTADFDFKVEELNVAIRNSAVTDFHAKVGVTANRLFGRPVTLTPASDPPNTVVLTGQYQRHGTVGTVTFGAPPSGAFDFGTTVAAKPVRVLDTLTVSGASLVPLASEPVKAGGTKLHSRVTLSGRLAFLANPFPGIEGLDLYSYGTGPGTGVGMSGIALTVNSELDAHGQHVPDSTTIDLDLSGVVVADDPAARRADGLVSKLPLTLTSFLSDPKGLDPSKLGGLPLNVVELTGPGGRVTSKPQYALQFRLPLGSLGALSDAHVSLDASLVLGWGPSTFTPDDDGAGVFVQLPAVSAGAFGFNLQGLLKTTFGDANLMRVTGVKDGPVYVVLFNNVALSLMGLKFPPQVITDFILFAGPATSGSSGIGWNLAATQVADKKALTAGEAP